MIVLRPFDRFDMPGIVTLKRESEITLAFVS
jgi:hypothetical protein